MGVLMIDSVGGRVEWLELMKEFYPLRMALDSELQKSPAGRDLKRTDPPLRTYPFACILLTSSTVFDRRQVVLCMEDSQRFVPIAPIWEVELTVADRWPVLIAKTIADVEQTMRESNAVGLHSEGERIIRELIELRDDMDHDRPLRYDTSCNLVASLII